MKLQFSKYEGAGNDFVMLDFRNQEISLDREMIVRLCDRHRGVGADGMITLSSPCKMTYYNADGSQGEMCGNGARCFVRFAHDLGIRCNPLTFTALDGTHEGKILGDGRVEISLKDAVIGELLIDTGVPHFVEFTDNVQKIDVENRGRKWRYDPRFPQGANVDFVQVVGDELRIRTYERGVEAETQACGTGAAAAAIMAHFMKKISTPRVRVAMPGGALEVSWDGEYKNVKLTGPARRVFEGTIEL